MAGWGQALRILCVCGALAVQAGVRAQTQAPDAALPGESAPPGYTEAIHEAVEHYSAQRWSRAFEAFARAHALQPSARTHRGLGLANFYLERFAAAREAFEQALVDTRKPLPDAQRAELAELLRACARETARVELRVVPESAHVELGGQPIERRVVFLDRGEHVIAARAEGHAAERIVLAVAGGEERVLEVALAALPQPAVVEAEPVTPIAQPKIERAANESQGRVYTWVAAGAVPVFAGIAAAVWFTGDAKHSAIERACAREDCDQAEADRRFEDASLDAHAAWSTVALAASGVALVTAAVLFAIEGEVSGENGLELETSTTGAAVRARF